MKIICSLVVFTLAVSLSCFAQDLTFGKFLGSINTNKFVGTSVYKLYEKQVEIVEVTTSGQSRSTTVTVKFNTCSASADFLAHSQLDKKILQGQIDVFEANPFSPGYTRIKYKIYFEASTVLSCNDTKACNNAMATTVVLKPQRICWIYYNYEAKSGKAVGTATNGYDIKSGQTWAVTPPNF